MGGSDVRSKPSLHRINTNSSLLIAVPKEKQVLLDFKHLSAWVPIMVTPGVAPAGAPESDVLPISISSKGDGAEAEGDKHASAKERQVLFSIDGTVAPGEILALMGPSGSGKSSLLSVLGGRSKARVTGSIQFAGRALDKQMKRNMGFVTQDDLLYAELTAFETLYYAALLRLPRHWTKEDKMERVEMVLAGLGLTKCRDTIIGNHMMRGVSGGERKRVSIGHELLTNPSMILLDEPTSGLDSTTALKLVHTLRSLARGGRTIIASIHQPSSRMYGAIDKLMLLSEGYTMYYGDAHASATWFAGLGVPVPFGVSIPDHLLDLACADLPNHSPSQSREVQESLLSAYVRRTVGTGPSGIQPSDFPNTATVTHKGDANGTSNNHHSKAEVPPKLSTPGGPLIGASNAASDDFTGRSSRSGSDSQRVQQVTVHDNPLSAGQLEVVVSSPHGEEGGIEHAGNLGIVLASPTSANKAESESAAKWGATWFQQVVILSQRCIKIRRFTSLSVQRFAEVLIPAALAGLFWWQVGANDPLSAKNIGDVNGLLFFEVLFMAFSSMFQAIFTFPADFQMLIKERQSGMYRLSAYYAARSTSDIPMDWLVPALFCVIIYFMAGLRLAAGAFFCNLFGMLLTLMVAQSIGLFIGATILNPKSALASATILMLSIMLVGGFYVQNIPVWISWMKYLSFVYYGYNLLLKVEYGGRGYSCADYYSKNPTAPPGLTWCPISSSDLLPVDVDTPATEEVCVLIGMLIFMRFAIYISLFQRTQFKSKTIKAE